MDKKTQKEAILEMFALHNNVVTLEQWLNSPLSAEYRARISELRAMGYDIVCKKGVTPSKNTYTLQKPAEALQSTLPEKVAEHGRRPIRATSVKSGMPASQIARKPFIYVENNVGCLNCGTYWSKADIGERCAVCL